MRGYCALKGSEWAESLSSSMTSGDDALAGTADNPVVGVIDDPGIGAADEATDDGETMVARSCSSTISANVPLICRTTSVAISVKSVRHSDVGVGAADSDVGAADTDVVAADCDSASF
jgi:hypothetical protein